MNHSLKKILKTIVRYVGDPAKNIFSDELKKDNGFLQIMEKTTSKSLDYRSNLRRLLVLDVLNGAQPKYDAEEECGPFYYHINANENPVCAEVEKGIYGPINKFERKVSFDSYESILRVNEKIIESMINLENKIFIDLLNMCAKEEKVIHVNQIKAYFDLFLNAGFANVLIGKNLVDTFIDLYDFDMCTHACIIDNTGYFGTYHGLSCIINNIQNNIVYMLKDPEYLGVMPMKENINIVVDDNELLISENIGAVIIIPKSIIKLKIEK